MTKIPHLAPPKRKREKGIRILVNEVRKCPRCGNDIEVFAARKMTKPASPGEYETVIELRRSDQKHLDED